MDAEETMLRRLAAAEGVDVSFALDTETARYFLSYLRPALIIASFPCDVEGRSITPWVRVTCGLSRTRLLAVVGAHARADARRAIEEGFDGVCMRPLEVDVLGARVRELLRDLRPEPPAPA